MCSIIGYKGKFDETLVRNLLDESRIRGVHAFGYYSNEGQYHSLDYKNFKETLLKEKPELFVAHLRYSTSGDYKDLNNNQPLVKYSKDKLALVFNGVISQLSKSNMEFQYETTIPSDNDGWILVDNLDNEDFLTDKSISFATTYIKNETLFAYRNKHRPMYYNQNKDRVVIASTRDILSRVGVEATNTIEHKLYEW